MNHAAGASLAERLGLCPGDVVSVVGAGGKTTLIFRLARELALYKTLVATTTRMYFPTTDAYDHLFIDESPTPTRLGISFLSGKPDADGKATPYPGLGKAVGLFDYTLIEADGAKRKLLKGWAAHEPVVIPETTKTVGVLNISLLGARATRENIHRPDAFFRLTGCKPGDTITAEHLRRLVSHGLFRGAFGEKILCVAGGHLDIGGDVDKCVNL